MLRVWGLGFEVRSVKCGVPDSGFGFEIGGSGFGAQLLGIGSRV